MVQSDAEDTDFIFLNLGFTRILRVGFLGSY